MKILELNTGLFPDAQTVAAAVKRLGPAHRVDSIDVRRADMRDEDWNRVVDAILDADLTISL